MTVSETTYPPLPAGADATPELANDWQPNIDGKPDYRCVWTPSLSEEDIRGVVIQHADGTIPAEGEDGPLVYLGSSDYRPDSARRIADNIRLVADQVDRWVGRTPSGHALLADARAAVERAYLSVRTEAGNSGDYLRAALDCITDAQAVTR